MSEAWSWGDYENQFGPRPDVGGVSRFPSPAAASEEVGGVSGACASSCGENRAHYGQSEVPGGQPTEPELRRDSLERQSDDGEGRGGSADPGENPAPVGDNYVVVLPDPLHERLIPFAEKRGITVATLVMSLVEIELDGDLIDLTLDGEG